MSNQTMLPQGSPQPTSWLGQIGGFLSDAVGAYANFEAVKARKNSTGQGRLEHAATPELENGAAVQVETPKTTPNSTQQETLVFGVPQKTLLLGFGGLLVVGLLLRK
ncbi:hypothetical protein CWC29_007380 [Pseudoalteromonas sp. S4498]|uniref:hypothetical protein n=1 Tax=Pseudoalteromonas galatheae TaxID=579562 RepID=UPI0011085453|nr:hypothetical protein [Pseudoalteromonas galatheae]NKC18666.1 hypothetical protein [Pseudoalteromonas galatheae]